jgi:ABC-2 type transport system ATP-binding protein
MSDWVIDVQGLHKHFGDKHVVNDLSLQVGRGEIYGFLGPNGSGKTTSIRLMCGLLTPDAGSGSCLGFDIRSQAAEIKRNVGYMTQKFSYWDDLSIRENLDFVARMYQMPNRREVVDRALESLGLQSRAKQPTGSLSGGWKQRLALAACMLHQPKLLLLDEPTAGVDPTARRDFWEELHRLAAQGVSVLVSTHYMDEAERCHQLAYIAYGRLLTNGRASAMIAEQNLLTWQVAGQDLTGLSNQLRAQAAIAQTVVFGEMLHVSGHDAAKVEACFAALGINHATPIATSLEDVFIYLMQRSQDNFGGER